MNKFNNLYIGIIFFFFSILLAYFILGKQFIDIEWLIGQAFVTSFFFIAILVCYKYAIYFSNNLFIRNLIIWNIIIKLSALFFSYFYFKSIFGIPLLGKSDAYMYHLTANEIADNFLNFSKILEDFNFSDRGAIIYYGVIYSLFAKSIFVAGMVNIFFATHSIILFYKTIRIINEEKIARLSAIVMSFIPIYNYYIGLHLKEIFFVWLIILGTYFIIKTFERNKLSFINLTFILFVGLSLFMFRTVVGLSFFTAVFFYIFFSQKIKINFFLKTLVSIVVFSAFVEFMLITQASEETEKYYEIVNNGTSFAESNINDKHDNRVNLKSFVGLPFQFVILITGPFPNLIKIYNNNTFGITRFALISDSFIKGFLGFFFILGILKKKIFLNNLFISIFLLLNMIILSVGGFALLYRMFLPILPFFIYIASISFYNLKKQENILFFFYLGLLVFIYMYFNISKI